MLLLNKKVIGYKKNNSDEIHFDAANIQKDLLAR